MITKSILTIQNEIHNHDMKKSEILVNVEFETSRLAEANEKLLKVIDEKTSFESNLRHLTSEAETLGPKVESKRTTFKITSDIEKLQTKITNIEVKTINAEELRKKYETKENMLVEYEDLLKTMKKSTQMYSELAESKKVFLKNLEETFTARVSNAFTNVLAFRKFQVRYVFLLQLKY